MLFRSSMPFLRDTEVQAFVEARAIRMKQLVVATVGGAQYRWSLRKLEKMSPAKEWAHLYPHSPNPTEVKYKPTAIELVERMF